MPESTSQLASKDEMYAQLGVINETLTNLALRLERYHGELKEVIVELRTQSQAQGEKIALNSERISLAQKKQDDDLNSLETNFDLKLEKQSIAHNQDAKDLKAELDKLRTQKNYQNWVIGVLSALFLAFMLYLNYKYGIPIAPVV